eukprot:CAMPEP_0180801082 /NCGR_PEP_ID=MMETSP1038_2-20121128/59453_1 /TAXON_ID=632150 /ORGANISM="Azadinium spinosum, Strain 3D9" /LENGTH=116 /DNA_ID=CAMNT_0022840865 /DNA_START=106 /DNA_END=453 /DNA_ORIENTATION=-
MTHEGHDACGAANPFLLARSNQKGLVGALEGVDESSGDKRRLLCLGELHQVPRLTLSPCAVGRENGGRQLLGHVLGASAAAVAIEDAELVEVRRSETVVVNLLGWTGVGVDAAAQA